MNKWEGKQLDWLSSLLLPWPGPLLLAACGPAMGQLVTPRADVGIRYYPSRRCHKDEARVRVGLARHRCQALSCSRKGSLLWEPPMLKPCLIFVILNQRVSLK